MAIQKIAITPESIIEEIGKMSAADFDALPFGAIQLDQRGMILLYNKAEEKLASRKRADVVGKNFFSEVAPCTKVKEFFGTFQKGVANRELNEVFDFTFKFPEGPREVRIRMIYSDASKSSVWVFVTPL